MPDHVLAIDQGTTSTRALLFDRHAQAVAVAQRELTQHYPRPGWVEHDPEGIWRDTLEVVREVIAASGVSIDDVAAIGIANQRETAILWDRASGAPIYPAVVWQDRRTADICQKLRLRGRRMKSGRKRACCSILTFPRPRSPGFSITCQARGTEPSGANWRSALSTAFCYGG